MFSDITQQTQDLLSKLNMQPAGLSKTTLAQATGLNAFDLRGPALNLYPVLTPLRNKLPRELSPEGDVATRWKAVTGINTGFSTPGVQEGKRGAEMAVTEQDFVATYSGLGHEGSINWEAVWAGGKEFDNKATLSKGLLNTLMISEERVLLGGNNSLALGTTPTPLATGPTAGGGPVAGTILVYCVALTLEGLTLATQSISGLGLIAASATALKGQVTRTNIDGTTTVFNGGNAQVSAASNGIVTSGGNLSLAATVAAVKGAAGYAWYAGTSAATASLYSITTVNAVSITAAPLGTQKANDAAVASDFSQNGTEFDGFLTLAAKTANAYNVSQNNATLTSDGANGIVEIDAALLSFWNTARLSPDEMWVHAQEAGNMAKKVAAPGSTSAIRQLNQMGTEPYLMGGASLNKYWNKFTNQWVSVNLHPNMPAGTILFKTNEIPYPLSEVGEVQLVRCRRDYYQIEWPIISRQYVYGVYCDEVLVHRAPFSLGVLSNIANG